jgi:hypothetical protein
MGHRHSIEYIKPASDGSEQDVFALVKIDWQIE